MKLTILTGCSTKYSASLPPGMAPQYALGETINSASACFNGITLSRQFGQNIFQFSFFGRQRIHFTTTKLLDKGRSVQNEFLTEHYHPLLPLLVSAIIFLAKKNIKVKKKQNFFISELILINYQKRSAADLLTNSAQFRQIRK